MNLLFPNLVPVIPASQGVSISQARTHLYLKRELSTVNETRYGFNEHSTNACLYLCYDLCSPPTLSTLLVGCNLGHQLICQICCLAETVVLHWGCSPPWLIEESLIDHQLFPLWLCRSSYSLSRSICSNQSLFLTSYLVPRPPPKTQNQCLSP